MRRTLFAISQDMEALGSILADVGGDLSHPDAAAAVEAWEAELAQDLEGKIDGYASLISEIEARAAIREQEAERIRRLVEADRRAADSLRERLRLVWEERGLGKIQTARYAVSLARNGGKAPVDIYSPVPPEWTKATTSVGPDRERIREALERGERLDFARLMERGSRIVIK